MTIVTTHHGQHDAAVCFACKLRSLSFNDGTPKKHQHNGDPWDGNPVVERIAELQAMNAREEAAWAAKQATGSPPEPSPKGE